ncbi:unnamed protein product [Allacma fusca]|uniref:Sialin n=1 Tax=Allacma fusca TaxID=39272 RepID=A0A8J2LBL3_9HEXA|nr:unnamed protein product [Allacma fusca]
MTEGNKNLDLDTVYVNSSKDDFIEAEGLKLLKPPKGFGVRHTVALMAFFGSIISYCMRINLSMAIVDMTYDNGTSDDSSDSADSCPVDDSGNSTTTSTGEFPWSSSDKGLILGAFFWGYVVAHIPAGNLAEKYGAKWVFGIGILITAIFQLLTPVITRWGGDDYSMTAIIVLRVIQGLGEGVTPPATHALLAQWAPPFERSKMGSFVYAGNQGGTMCAMIISGAIINADFLGGWPGVFYTFGILALVWLAAWSYLVHSKPSQHPRISQEELQYIQGSMSGQTTTKRMSTPWKQILRSRAVWAIVAAQLGNGWGLYTLLTYMPTYMSSVLHFDIKDNSLLSALPYFCMLSAALITSWVADMLRTKRIFSTTNTRRLFNCIGHWGPAVALIGAAYTGCDKVLTVVLLTVTVALSGTVGAGYQINHIDIAPNHAGTLMGFCNGISNLAGIAAPYVAGLITTDESSLASWRIVFFLASGIYFLDNLIYVIFVSGQEQPWNRPPEETQEEKKQEE